MGSSCNYIIRYSKDITLLESLRLHSPPLGAFHRVQLALEWLTKYRLFGEILTDREHHQILENIVSYCFVI
jgi:hypothetical protein